MIADIGAAKKPHPAAPKQKPDPLRYVLTDFAPWLRDSAFDAKPAVEWTEEDEIKLAAARITGALLQHRRLNHANQV